MKIFLTSPARDQVDALIEQHLESEITAKNVGSMRDWPGNQFNEEPESIAENGYLIQRRRTNIGSGEAAYRAAVQSLRQGDCFDLPWVNFYSTDGLNAGATYCLIASAFGLKPASLGRIIYSENQTQPTEHEKLYAVGIGTLALHAMIGEEKIAIAWNRRSNDVDLLIGSVSRPATWLTQLFAWYLRQQQRRFARDSAMRMRQAVANLPPSLNENQEETAR